MNNDLIRRGDVLALKEVITEEFHEHGASMSISHSVVTVDNINAIPPAVEQPMSAVEFLKQYSRMCSSYPAYGNDTGCKGCPLEYDATCDLLRSERAEHFVEVTEKWAQEHPERSEEE